MQISDKLIKEITKMGGDEVKLGADTELRVIPTGSLYLDCLIGVGGWPCGKVNVIVGEESSGKSTLCTLAMAEAQRRNKRVVYVDLESSFDVERAERMGVNTDVTKGGLLVVRPLNLEKAGDITVKMASSGEVDLIIFDSVGGASIKALEEGEVEDAVVGRKAKTMSNFMMKLGTPLGFTKTGIIFIQQWRDTFDMYKPFQLAGGRAFRHAAQTVVQLGAKAPKEVKDGTLNVTAVIRKNKVAVPFKNGVFTMYPNGRIDRNEEIAAIYTDNTNYAANYDSLDKTFSEALGVERAGAWYTFPSEVFGVNNKFQGSNAFLEALRAEPELAEKAEAEIRSKIMRQSVVF